MALFYTKCSLDSRVIRIGFRFPNNLTTSKPHSSCWVFMTEEVYEIRPNPMRTLPILSLIVLFPPPIVYRNWVLRRSYSFLVIAELLTSANSR